MSLPWEVTAAAGAVIADHDRLEDGSCKCRHLGGWAETVQAHGEHVADELEGAGFLRDPADDARRQAFTDIVAALENHDEWSARRVVWSLFASEEGLTS